MKHLSRIFFFFLIQLHVTLIAFGQAWPPKITLKVGDKAPPLKVQKWIKGEPVDRFVLGKVYLIEFGSVGCIPCRAAIPHLSELARKYENNVTLINVFTDASIPNVERFIAKMGDRISFKVAADGSRKVMQNTWTTAFGVYGIPATFLIDKKGRIAWQGGPMNVENEMLDQLIEGKFDALAIAKRQREIQQVIEQMSKAEDQGDYTTAIAKVDRLIELQPREPYNSVKKFKILLEFDEAKAYAYGRELLNDQFKNTEPNLYELGQAMLNINEKSPLKQADWALAIDIFERANFLCKDDMTIAGRSKHEAEVYALTGDYQKSIETIEKGIAILNRLSTSEAKEVGDVLKTYLEDYKKKLN